MTLRPNLICLPLDDDMVVFSPEAQHLLGLNSSAAFVFAELQQGTPAAEIAKMLTGRGGITLNEASRWVTATLDLLGSYGMLAEGPTRAVPSPRMQYENQPVAAQRIANMPPYASFQPVAEKHYRLLETCALIRFGNLAQRRMVDAAIGHLATDSCATPSITVDIRAQALDEQQTRSDVYRNGKAIDYAARLSFLGPIVKATLWQSAVNAHDFSHYIHAGVVGTGKSCILLPASPGSGKSSLTAALSHRGFRYFSDEVALIERGTFMVPAVPLALCVKSTGWDLIARYYPEILTLPVHRRLDGKVVRYLPPPSGAIGQESAPVSHIIFPRYDASLATELKPIARTEAVRRLMDECLGLADPLSQQNVAEFIHWISSVECYALTYSQLDEAVNLIAHAVNYDLYSIA